MTTTLRTIVVAGDLDALDVVDEYVHQAAAQVGLDKKTTYKLHLAVDEIVTNIVTHGYEENGIQGDIRLSASAADQSLTIVVEDNAPAYDPANGPKPTLSGPIEERPLGGLGIFLTQRSVDKFYYERTADCNRSVFVVNIPA